jgi:hypothetical protein
MDALIAEKVMGWSSVGPIRDSRGYVLYTAGVDTGGGGLEVIPHYSTGIASAWQVVESATSWPHEFAIEQVATIDGSMRMEWRARFRDTGEPDDWSYAPTAPLAICLAALKAVEGGEG